MKNFFHVYYYYSNSITVGGSPRVCDKTYTNFSEYCMAAGIDFRIFWSKNAIIIGWKVIQLWHILLCVNYWVYERNFCIVIKSFLCHFEQNGATMSLLKIASRNRMFSPLRIEAKLIENLLPLGLEDDEPHLNKRPEYA